MGIIIGSITCIMCIVTYSRICKRNQDVPIKGKKALSPVLLGMAAPLLATLLVLGLSLVVIQMNGGNVENVQPIIKLPLALRSFVRSFILAGFTEEAIKCGLLCAAIAIIKPKSVYEYGAAGAGVGLGFTLVEDILYGQSSGITTIIRIPTFALHMVFGIIMGTYIGKAKAAKRDDIPGKGYMWKAMIIPVLWHTVYDAALATNAAFDSENDVIVLAGIIIALLVTIISVIMQFKVLKKFAKSSEECSQIPV